MQIIQGLGLFGGAIVLFSLLAGTAAAMGRPRWVAGSPKSYRPTPVAVAMALCAFIVAVVVGTATCLDAIRMSGLWPNGDPFIILGQTALGAALSIALVGTCASYLGPTVYDYLLGPRGCSRTPNAFLTSKGRWMDLP